MLLFNLKFHIFTIEINKRTLEALCLPEQTNAFITILLRNIQ